MSHKNKVYIVSHKDVRGEVRWTSVGYSFVEAEDGQVSIHFNAEVKLRDNDSMTFHGKWNGGETEALLREIGFHSERFAHERREQIVQIKEELRQTAAALAG